MVKSRAKTVAEYLRALPADRRAVVGIVRDAIRHALPRGYQEAMNWGMIAWQVPLSRYPETYNGRPLLFAALAAQKSNYALYLMCVYQNRKLEAILRSAYARLGRKPDMGKSCIRFRNIEDLPLAAIRKVVASVPLESFIAIYEKARQ